MEQGFTTNETPLLLANYALARIYYAKVRDTNFINKSNTNCFIPI